MSGDTPSGVTITLGNDTISASAVARATPAEVFDFVRRPANHDRISGDETVRGVRTGPDVLSLDDKFGMKMKILGIPYAITSKVVEFEEDRVIAWCHPGGHRWRWEVELTDDGGAKVTETFDMTTAKFPPALRVVGYPKRHEDNVERSVANVVAHFAPSGA